jgi:hypothetical protein
VVDMERLLTKNFERNKPSLDGYGAANGNGVGVAAKPRPAAVFLHKRLMLRKKDPGP